MDSIELFGENYSMSAKSVKVSRNISIKLSFEANVINQKL